MIILIIIKKYDNIDESNSNTLRGIEPGTSKLVSRDVTHCATEYVRQVLIIKIIIQ